MSFVIDSAVTRQLELLPAEKVEITVASECVSELFFIVKNVGIL